MLKYLIRGLLALLLFAAPAAYADDISNGSWNTTDGSNTASPPNGWPAGMFPNQVEPTARSNMGGVKRWWERANAGLSTTGSAGAYVLTPTNTSYPTAYTQGEIYCAKANFTSVGNDTLNVNSLGAKALYNNLARVGAGSITNGQQFCAAYDGALNSAAGGFQLLSGIPLTQTLATRQVLTSSGTYTTPAGARQLRIRMVGGGGGGGGGFGTSNGAAGSDGGDTVFNSVHAAGGQHGSGGTSSGQGNGGAGTTNGTGSASWRSLGQGGAGGVQSPNAAPGASGGSSILGGGARGGIAGENALGYGGGGGGGQSGPGGASGGGGQGGEYVELIINSPNSTYAETIGVGGNGGSTAGAYDGGNGFQGVIIVDEYY